MRYSYTTIWVSLVFVAVIVSVGCKELFDPFTDKQAIVERLQFTYNINFIASGKLATKTAKRGAIGQLHLQSIPHDNSIAVRGTVNTDVNIAIGAQGVTHHLNHDYVPQQTPPVYNMFTLPLRFRRLAIAHRSTVKAVNTLLQEIDQREQELLTAGRNVYPDFATLHVVNSGDYSFTGLAKQTKLTFAGKRFSTESSTIRKEIEARRHSIKKSVVYQQDLLRPAPAQEFATEMLYRKAVAVYRRVHPDLRREPHPFTPSFKSKGKQTSAHAKTLQKVVTALAITKQAKLLLAQTLLRLYEPIYLGHYQFDLLGHKEKLTLAANVDDTHKNTQQRRVVLSYKLSASSASQGNFQLGHYNYDRTNRPLYISIDLQPIGKGKLDLLLQN